MGCPGKLAPPAFADLDTVGFPRSERADSAKLEAILRTRTWCIKGLPTGVFHEEGEIKP